MESRKQESLSTITVEDTNLESLQSKSSIITAGYRSDPFLLSIVSNIKKRRSPSINLCYFARNLALEVSFEKAILHFSRTYSTTSKKFQVLSCGSGFDTVYFKIRNAGTILPESCLFIEADLPRVVKRKCEMIRDSNYLQAPFQGDCEMKVFSDGSFRVGKNFVNIACDLRNLEDFRSKLMTIAGIDFGVTTIILCECSLTYVEPQHATKFFEWSKSVFTDAIFINYEQIRPFDRFGNIMTTHFEKRQTPLLNVKDFPTLESHSKRFKDAGWPNVIAKDLTSIWNDFLTDTDKSIIQSSSDCFDEFEELILKCNHYILLVARSNSLPIHEVIPCFRESTIEDAQETSIAIPSLSTIPLEQTDSFERYGHSVHSFERYGHSVHSIDSSTILIVGGFSNHDSRDGSISLCDKTSLRVRSQQKNIIPDRFSLYHAGDVLPNTNKLLIFGGRASPTNPSQDLLLISIQEDDSFHNKILSSRTPSPSARWKHSFTRVDEATFILIGGKSSKEIFSDIHLFSLEGNEWSHFPHSCPKGLFSHSANRWRNFIVVSGGLTDYNSFNEDLLFIDTNNKTLKVESFNCKVPRIFSHSSHICQDNLWLIGGVAPQNEPAVVLIRLRSGLVQHFDYLSISDTNLTFNHGSFVNAKGDFVIVGGGGNCFSFGKRINRLPLLLRKPSSML